MKTDQEKLEILRRGVAGEMLGWSWPNSKKWYGPRKIEEIRCIDWDENDYDLWDNVKPKPVLFKDDDWVMRKDGTCFDNDKEAFKMKWRRVSSPEFADLYQLAPPEPNAEELKKQGLEWTGEFRPPRQGDWYIADDGLPLQACINHDPMSSVTKPRYILRRIEKRKVVRECPIYEFCNCLVFDRDSYPVAIYHVISLPNFRGFKWKSDVIRVDLPWRFNPKHTDEVEHADFVLLEVEE